MVGDREIKIYVLRGGKGDPNTASYNRFQSIVKMIDMYYKVEVIGFRKIEKSFKNRYIHAISSRLRYIKEVLKLPQVNKTSKGAIMLLGISPFTSLIIFIIAKIKGYYILGEINEYPIYHRNNDKIKIFFYNILKIWWRFKIFDLLFIMTDELISFYKPYARKNSFIRKLPMTVDFDRFIQIEKKVKTKYIFYAGSFSQKKDGILSLIEAFYIVKKNHPDIKLWIAGNGTAAQNIEIEKIIEKLKISEDIRLLGIVSRDQIPNYMINAQLLVLPRPSSLQASGGFPTKLGEYLATSNPVIVSRVGEIDQFLTDNDVFFINPDNLKNDLIKKIDYVLSNYSEAKKIGQNGRQLAYKYFSLQKNSEVIREVLEKLFT